MSAKTNKVVSDAFKLSVDGGQTNAYWQPAQALKKHAWVHPEETIKLTDLVKILEKHSDIWETKIDETLNAPE